MDWKQRARAVFDVPKPAHFTDYGHCCECAEHDQMLLAFDRDSIGLQQLGNPGWDPLCFSSVEGFLYYIPAMVRLTLDGIDNPKECYLDQLLFHLIHDGKENRIVKACDAEQRRFIADFLAHLIEAHIGRIEAYASCTDDVLKAHEIWSAA